MFFLPDKFSCTTCPLIQGSFQFLDFLIYSAQILEDIEHRLLKDMEYAKEHGIDVHELLGALQARKGKFSVSEPHHRKLTTD